MKASWTTAANLTAQIALRDRMCDQAIRFAARGCFFANQANQDRQTIVLNFLYTQFLVIVWRADHQFTSARKEVQPHDVVSRRVKIRSYEVGLYFRDGEFQRLLTAGRHWLFDPLWKVRVDVVSQRDPWLNPRQAGRDRQERCAHRSAPRSLT